MEEGLGAETQKRRTEEEKGWLVCNKWLTIITTPPLFFISPPHKICWRPALCGADFDRRSSQATVCRKAPHNLKRAPQADPCIGIGLDCICGSISYLFADAILPVSA